MATIIFKVEDTETKPITKGKRAGQNFLRVKIPDRPWASAFKSDDANTILENPDSVFKADWEETQSDDGEMTFYNLSNVKVSTDEAPPTSPSQPRGGLDAAYSKSTLSKEEWALKDRKDWMRRLYMGHLANLTAVLEPGVGWDFYEKQVIRKARAYANSDLQWIEGGGTEEPF